MGPYKEKLMSRAKEQKLNNVHFFPLQEPHQFNNFLNMADVHLVLQKKSASDLVMPSKLTTILAVGGLALITAEPGTSLFETVSDNHMGIVIPSEDLILLEEAIITCCNCENSLVKINGRSYAENHLNKNNILTRIFNKLENKSMVMREENAALEFVELK